jgi:hypothetical protein
VGSGTIGGAQTTEAVFFPSGWSDVGTTTDDNQLIRFGWNAVLTQSGSLALAVVGGTIEVITGS